MKKIIIILIGLLFIGIGAYILFSGNEMKKKCTGIVTGKVVEVEEERHTDKYGNTSTIYYPIVEYVVDGKIIRNKYNIGSNSEKYSRDTKITILYNPNKIDEFMIKGDMSSNIMGIGFPILGLIVIITGIFNKKILQYKGNYVKL